MSSAEPVANFVVEHLKASEVHRQFGFSGDSINLVHGAPNRA